MHVLTCISEVCFHYVTLLLTLPCMCCTHSWDSYHLHQYTYFAVACSYMHNPRVSYHKLATACMRYGFIVTYTVCITWLVVDNIICVYAFQGNDSIAIELISWLLLPYKESSTKDSLLPWVSYIII